MKKVTPKILSGFMELLPDEQIVFNYMKARLESAFESFGFLPMDTPIIESAEVLLAKAGGDTEKEIYRFIKGSNDMCLRFDQTVPLARFVAEHHNDLVFPFRRYQIGKVYRGERPQKGRFREFYQADIDIIGNGGLAGIYDAEILATTVWALKSLGVPAFRLHISTRKLLQGLLEELGLEEKATEVLRVIDKVSKIGPSEVKALLEKEGVASEKADKILEFANINGKAQDVLVSLGNFGFKNQTFVAGVQELETLADNLKNFDVEESDYCFDLSIARGLDYYSGMVFETFFVDRENLGSIASGGRYENLAENFTDKPLPGVGVGMGLTRMFDILRSEKLLPAKAPKTTIDAVVVPMDEGQKGYAINVASAFRRAGIRTEVFFEDTKFKNKMAHAGKTGARFAVILGEDEQKTKVVALKNLEEFSQEVLPVQDAIKKIKA